MRIGGLRQTMCGMEPAATTIASEPQATPTDEHRLQIGAVASIAGPMMSAAAAALLRAVGEAAAMALVCPPRQNGRSDGQRAKCSLSGGRARSGSPFARYGRRSGPAANS